MKVIVVAIACLLAGASALPKLHNVQGSDIEAAIRSGDTRLVTGSIVDAIEDAAQAIRDAGLDPVEIDSRKIDYALPVPSIFNAVAGLEGFLLRGLSNIVVNRMNYAVLTSRLTFNIELPEILFCVDSSSWDVNFFGRNYNGRFSGCTSVRSIVIAGEVRINIGIISGISIRSVDVTFSLAGIDSNHILQVQGIDFSNVLNNHLSATIPGTLKDHERDINELLTIVFRDVAESIL